MSNNYEGEMDIAFLEMQDIKVVKYQPWQFGLFHPDLYGKFVWYPKKGTLMYESDETIYKVGEFNDTEIVLEKIMQKINEQQ